MSRPGVITSVRQAAAACNVTPPVIRRWLSLGLVHGPPWTLQQLQRLRDETDPEGRRRGPQAAHGTLTRWLEDCDCDRCRDTQEDAARERFRRKAQERLPAEVRQLFLDAIYRGQPFRQILRDLGLTSNQVWGLTRTDEEWSAQLDAALTATRRDVASMSSPGVSNRIRFNISRLILRRVKRVDLIQHHRPSWQTCRR